MATIWDSTELGNQQCPGLGFRLDQGTGLLGFLSAGRGDRILALSLLKLGQSIPHP